MSSPVRVVLTTAPSPEEAERISGTLVSERLVACANIVPGIVSIFRWEDAVQRESEVLVILKTTEAGLSRLTDRLVELHPYDVPEVVAVDAAGGHAPYLDWVSGEVGDG